MAASQSLANYHRTTASNLKVFRWSLLTFPARTKKQFHCVAEARRYGGDKKNAASASLFRNMAISVSTVNSARGRIQCFSASASLLATEHSTETPPVVPPVQTVIPSPQDPVKTVTKELGAFQHLPMVMCSHDILPSALKKAKNVGPTKGISNIAKRVRNKGAKQLDALTKELSLPLRMYIDNFPRKHQLHAYEYALIDLTFGTGKYEEVLENVNTFRKKILDVGKNYASLCAKTTSKRDAEAILKEGFSKLEEHFQKNGAMIDELVNVAKTLRAMPVFNLNVPTLCLVGAPNVGKSSLVRVLSTGKPEVCNYPFTTRGISMGHIFINMDVYQVTDTPGLLRRPDDERNNMEKLTLAALSYLPTAVVYVHDLTGECGVKVSDQFLLYREMKEKFQERPWLDVVSKADLLPQNPPSTKDLLPSDSEEYYKAFGPEGSMLVSVQTGLGVGQLKERVLSLLINHFPEQLNSSINGSMLNESKQS